MWIVAAPRVLEGPGGATEAHPAANTGKALKSSRQREPGDSPLTSRVSRAD